LQELNGDRNLECEQLLHDPVTLQFYLGQLVKSENSHNTDGSLDAVQDIDDSCSSAEFGARCAVHSVDDPLDNSKDDTAWKDLKDGNPS
jgi:hypothetical protein